MNSAKLIEIYFMFFAKEIKDDMMINHNIDVSTKNQFPTINYLSLLRHIDFQNVYKAVRIWIRCKSLHEPFDLNVKRIQTKQANRLMNELGKLFSNGSARINKLSLDIRHFEHYTDESSIEFKSWPCYSGAYYPGPYDKSLCQLREFVCGGKFSKNTIIFGLTKTCEEIESITIEDSFETSSEFLANLMKNQRRLQHFVLANWKSDSKCILSSLAKTKTLRHIEFIGCDFPENDEEDDDRKHYFDGLIKCINLETLKFEQCKNLSTKLMKPFIQAEFRNLTKLHFDNDSNPADPPTIELQSIIVNAKDSLKEIFFNIQLSLHVDILDTVATNCPNLKKLSVNIENDSEIRQLIGLFQHCKHLLELRISRKKYPLFSIGKTSLVELGAVIPPSLKKLELLGFTFEVSTWTAFLDQCPGSINSFVFNLKQQSYINIVKNYANRHNKKLKNDSYIEISEYVSLELENKNHLRSL
ncbi:10700_t:CDS:1 [Diversispora eburnea]|uniref:10700_t:CDS:1 n=1 Tax=Diversispora eburnea TaxID=1213867 RepID=A0A9N9B488_9GLOM|nr:10700_t:CDS:1 [Diversispora eburnea]